MIKFLLNLGCNVSGDLSMQNEMACFPNSWVKQTKVNTLLKKGRITPK